MEWLNYHHLLYFYVVATEGSVTAACERLHVAQPTISSQLRKLERSVGSKLFQRAGRHLVLTDTGKLVLEYAREIFSLGQELGEVLQGMSGDRPLQLKVGVLDVLPKLISYRMLQPVFELPESVRLHCTEGKLDELVLEMAAHRLDVVLSDAPAPPSPNIKVYTHLLGECTVSAFAISDIASRFRKGFPGSLAEAPLLMSGRQTVLRQTLDLWFERHNIRPTIVAEFQDSALTKTFGQAGLGVFFGPSAIHREICEQYAVVRLGELDDLTERFYAISPERKIKHPAVSELWREGRQSLFAQAPGGS